MSQPAFASAGRRMLATVLLLGTLAVGLTACGGSGSSTGTTGGSTGAQFQARLNLAKCFRAHGINVPDPSTGGGPAGGGGFFRTLRTLPQAQVTAARQACQQYFAQAFPQLNLSPAQQEQRRQQLVKFAQCMRSHGINIPDPTPGQDRGFGIGRQLRSLDNNPAFQTANKACSGLRPRFGGGRGPGGPGGGPPGA